MKHALLTGLGLTMLAATAHAGDAPAPAAADASKTTVSAAPTVAYYPAAPHWPAFPAAHGAQPIYVQPALPHAEWPQQTNPAAPAAPGYAPGSYSVVPRRSTKRRGRKSMGNRFGCGIAGGPFGRSSRSKQNRVRGWRSTKRRHRNVQAQPAPIWVYPAAPAQQPVTPPVIAHLPTSKPVTAANEKPKRKAPQ